MAIDPKFQPTRPLRGATRPDNEKLAELMISTHAPLAGRDAFAARSFLCPINFNPRAPCGARRQ